MKIRICRDLDDMLAGSPSLLGELDCRAEGLIDRQARG